MQLKILATFAIVALFSGTAMSQPVQRAPLPERPLPPSAQDSVDVDRVALGVTPPDYEYIVAQPERTLGLIQRLFRERAVLRGQNAHMKTEIDALNFKISEMTRFGGTQVIAYCASETISRNTAGMEEDCSITGYRCNQVSGLCNRIARATSMCADNYVLDENSGRCIDTRTLN